MPSTKKRFLHAKIENNTQNEDILAAFEKERPPTLSHRRPYELSN